MLPKTTTRVQENTAPEINERIQQEIRDNVRMYSCACPELIERRLQELDAEWDIERTLEAGAGAVGFTSLLLGLTGKRAFLALPVLITGFLLVHAVQGWCPPLLFLRHLGVRTPGEIEQERQALKALRGDYKGLKPVGECHCMEDVSAYVEAAQR
ncbi:MAG: hypothetical protein ABFE08_09180 [Armatimonadia bacterium]